MNKNTIKNVVFDLDGTLMRSDSTIYKSTIKTLNDFNIQCELPEKEFTNKIGLHFKDIFNDFRIEVENLDYFIEKYKDCYFDFIDETVSI